MVLDLYFHWKFYRSEVANNKNFYIFLQRILKNHIIRIFKYIVITLIAIVVAIYATSLLLRLESVQHRAAYYVTRAINDLSDLPVSIGSVQVQHMNKVVLKSICITDQRGDTAINIPKITAHLSPLHMLKGNIRVNTLMIGRPSVKLYRTNEESPLNIQFILDRLAGDSTNKQSPLPDIRINQIQLYDGYASYDVESSKKETVGFSPQHIEVKDITCNLSLKKLNSDTLSLYIRSISGEERSGIKIEKLQAKVNANHQNIRIENFLLAMPVSRLQSKLFTLKHKGEKAFEINGDIYGKTISASDFKALLPTLGSDLPTLSLRIKAKGNNKKAFAGISVYTEDNSLQVTSNATIGNSLIEERRTIDLNITEGHIENTAVAHIQKIFGDSTGSLDIIKRIKRMEIKSNVNYAGKELLGNINLTTPHGNIIGNVHIDTEKNYTANIQGTNLDLGKLLQAEDFGICNADLVASGIMDGKTPAGTFHSSISELEYKGYTHSPILIDGQHSENNFSTTATFTDPNACGEINFFLTNNDNRQDFRLKARIDSMRPGSINLNEDSKGCISGILEGDYEIHDNGKSQLDARIYNATISTTEGKKSLRTFHITDNNLTDTRLLLLSSDFMDMNIAGHFSYKGIANTFHNILHSHLPALTASQNRKKANNEYSFKINIKETELISELLGLPVTINEQSNIVGSCDDNRRLFYLNARLNNCDIDGSKYRSIDATAISTNDKITLDAKIAHPQIIGKKLLYESSENDMAINIGCIAHHNHINNNIQWERHMAPIGNGTFEMDVTLANGDNGLLSFDAHLKPSKIVYNDTEWVLQPCHISSDGKQYTINKFSLQSDKQWIKVDGVVGETEEDKLAISLKDISVEEILNLVNFHSVDFGGKATGEIALSRMLNHPQFSSELNVENFSFEHGYMGDLDVKAAWHEEDKAVYLTGDIYDVNNSHTIVSGLVSPANDTINLKIDADKARVEFLNNMLEGILSEVDGNATGTLSVVGPLGAPNLIGNIRANGSLKLNVTNTKYRMQNGAVAFTYNKMTFLDFPIADTYGNRGKINGYVDHNSLSDFTCTLNIDAENLLAYHTEGFSEFPFYGTAFVTGTANLTADDRGIFLHANIRSNEGSSFVYDAGSTGSVTSNKFISFTDKSKREQRIKEFEKNEINRNSLLSRLNLEFILDITPDMQLKVFTNVKAGDYIDLYGAGPITAIYDEKDGFSMKGRLDLERGTYKFTMQDIFPKEFDIITGSTLNFAGDPFDADLNLKTKYLVPSVSLSDLDPDGRRYKSVKVNCLMDITGKLNAPQLNFDIELPDANEEQRELLASAITTPEQKNMQFIYLIGIGKFYTYDYNRNSNSDTESSTAMESLISNTISGQLNNMLSQIIDNRNWNISGNFSSSERGWNSMEVEGILEGRLLNNRLLINGNFGYRENPMANTNFVGDFEVQWMLDKNGKVSLKAYNKTNDRYFSESTLTTQGAGIILRHDFNEWLWWMKNSKKKRENKIESEETEK